jgi:hypothetical protein
LFCLLAVLSFWAALPAFAVTGSPPLSLQRKTLPLEKVRRFELPPVDKQAELRADETTAAAVPLRFAAVRLIRASPTTEGTWEQLADGRLWRLRIRAAGASDLNLGFTRFWLPAGATLHVISRTEPYFQGPYTARDNQHHGQLWTAVVPGDEVVVELFVPAQAQAEPQLILGQVGAGYRDFFHNPQGGAAPLAEANCNIDVVCPPGAAWTNEIRSVAVYTINGAFACSGTLLADTAGDFRNYFLTANHCGLDAANAATAVVYWNYQSTNCGTHGPGSLAQNQSGATFRASDPDVDFALIELDDIPEASFAVYYSGWDRSGVAPAGGVGIHHPECDVKAISISSNALTTVNSCIGIVTTNTHWQVIWSLGITQPGSSGSGIWDPATHKLVGTLSGGSVSCADPTNPDCYGKYSLAWDVGATPAGRLRDWLDPLGTGAVSVSGVDPILNTLLRPAGTLLVSEDCFPTNGAIDPGETVSVNFALENFGGISTTDLVATLLATGGVTLPCPAQHYGAVGSGAVASRTFTFTANGYCGGPLTPVLQLQDGSRNLGTAAFGFTLGTPVPVVVFSEAFDAVTVPALPPGWTTLGNLGSPLWVTSNAQADTPPNSAYVAEATFVADSSLVSPSVFVNATGAQVNFRQRYDVEEGYDGGVLEISTDAGTFTDIVSAGGSFLTNGYNEALSLYYQNPLAGRDAWTGDSGGFIPTTALLPAQTAGHYVRLRWRFGSDNSYAIGGWYVDTVSITEPGYSCCGSLTPPLLYNLQTVGTNSLSFSYDAVTGQTYFVEASTNAEGRNWTVVQTNSGGNSRLSYTNSGVLSGQQFFRVRSQ